ncbi:hypothetical protein AA313_de0200482 [Arthrobotrys entomopaga]|nr:hypothetical protein AA313_de0200482 [Arthrobotrys entomopaga]
MQKFWNQVRDASRGRKAESEDESKAIATPGSGYPYSQYSRQHPPTYESAVLETQDLPTSYSLLTSLQLSNSGLQKKLLDLESSLGSLEYKIELLFRAQLHALESLQLDRVKDAEKQPTHSPVSQAEPPHLQPPPWTSLSPIPSEEARVGPERPSYPDSGRRNSLSSTHVDYKDKSEIKSVGLSSENIPTSSYDHKSYDREERYTELAQCESCRCRQSSCEPRFRLDGLVKCDACIWYGTDCGEFELGVWSPNRYYDPRWDESNPKPFVLQPGAPYMDTTKDDADATDVPVSESHFENVSINNPPIYTETMATVDMAVVDTLIVKTCQENHSDHTTEANRPATDKGTAIERIGDPCENEEMNEKLSAFYLLVLVLTLTDDRIWETLPADDLNRSVAKDISFHDSSHLATYRHDTRKSNIKFEGRSVEISETEEENPGLGETLTGCSIYSTGLSYKSYGLNPEEHSLAIYDTAEESSSQLSSTNNRTNTLGSDTRQGNGHGRILKRTRKDPDKSGDGDDSDRRLPKKTITEAMREIGKKFACPFAKAYPQDYPRCLLIFRQNLSGIKEHLKRSHFGGTLPPELFKKRTWDEVFVYCNNNSISYPIPSPYLDITVPMQLVQECRDQLVKMGPLVMINEGLQHVTHAGVAGANINRVSPRPILPRSIQSSDEETIASGEISDITTSSMRDSGFSTTPTSNVDSPTFNPPTIDQHVVTIINDGQLGSDIEPLSTNKLDSLMSGSPSQIIGYEDFSEFMYSTQDFDVTQNFGFLVAPDEEVQALSEDHYLDPGMDRLHEKILLSSTENTTNKTNISSGEVTSSADITPPPPLTPDDSSGTSSTQSPDPIPTSRKRYTVRIKRQGENSDHGTAEKRGPQKFQFDSMQEFRDNFESWMMAKFSDPVFDWRAWEFEDPKDSDRFSDLDDLAEQLQFIWDGYRTESAAFFLVRKELKVLNDRQILLR